MRIARLQAQHLRESAARVDTPSRYIEGINRANQALDSWVWDRTMQEMETGTSGVRLNAGGSSTQQRMVSSDNGTSAQVSIGSPLTNPSHGMDQVAGRWHEEFYRAQILESIQQGRYGVTQQNLEADWTR